MEGCFTQKSFSSSLSKDGRIGTTNMPFCEQMLDKESNNETILSSTLSARIGSTIEIIFSLKAHWLASDNLKN